MLLFLTKNNVKWQENSCNSTLFHNNNLISNFKVEKELYNESFPEQRSLIQNKSTIPSVFTPLTHNFFSLFQFTADDIKSAVNKLDPNRTHGHDMISICMIKLCGDSIYKSLQIIFKSCFKPGYFFSRMEKS